MKSRVSVLIAAAIVMAILFSCTQKRDPTPSMAELQAQIVEIQRAQASLNARMDTINHDLYVLKESAIRNKEAINRLEDTVKRPQVTIRSGSEPSPAPKNTKQEAVAPSPTAGEFVSPPPHVEKRKSEPITSEIPRASDLGLPKETEAEVATVVKLIEQGQYGMAIYEINDLTTKDRRSADVAVLKLLLGECYYKLKDYPQAIEEFFKVLAIKEVGGELSAQALYKVGLCYEMLDDPKEAGSYYGRVVNEYPGTEAAGQAQKRRAALEK